MWDTFRRCGIVSHLRYKRSSCTLQVVAREPCQPQNEECGAVKEDDEECGAVFVDIDLVNSLLLELEAGHRRPYDTIDGLLLGFARVVAEAAVRAFLAFACIEDEYELAQGSCFELCESLCRCSTLLAFKAVCCLPISVK